MDEEKEIEKEIEQMAAEIQYAMDAVQEKNKTAIPAEVLAWYLVQRKDYRKADEVRKETAKAVAYDICSTILARCGLAHSVALTSTRETAAEAYKYILALAKQMMTLYGIEVDE